MTLPRQTVCSELIRFPGSIEVLTLIVGQRLRFTLIGVGAGIVGALGLTHFLSSLLYGVKPNDPLTFTVVSLIVTAVALIATYIPARRRVSIQWLRCVTSKGPCHCCEAIRRIAIAVSKGTGRPGVGRSK